MSLEWFDRLVENLEMNLCMECDLIEELVDDGMIEFTVNRVSKIPYFQIDIASDELEDESTERSLTVYFDQSHNEFYVESYEEVNDELYKTRIILEDDHEIIRFIHKDIHQILEEETELESPNEDVIDKILHSLPNNNLHALHYLQAHPEKVEWLNEETVKVNMIEDPEHFITVNHTLSYQFGIIPDLNIGIIRELNKIEPIGEEIEGFSFNKDFVFDLKYEQFLSMNMMKNFHRYTDLDDGLNEDIGS